MGRCQFTTLGVWSAVRCQRYSSAVVSKPITAQIAAGMGWGAYESLKSQNIQGIVTNVGTIDEAVKLYLEDKLPNLMERLH